MLEGLEGKTVTLKADPKDESFLKKAVAVRDIAIAEGAIILFACAIEKVKDGDSVDNAVRRAIDGVLEKRAKEAKEKGDFLTFSSVFMRVVTRAGETLDKCYGGKWGQPVDKDHATMMILFASYALHCDMVELAIANGAVVE